jgi:hypothetical protein
VTRPTGASNEQVKAIGLFEVAKDYSSAANSDYAYYQDGMRPTGQKIDSDIHNPDEL